MIESRVQRMDRFAIVDEHSVLFCANQEIAGRGRQDGGKGTSFGVSRIDLAESLSVEGQNPLIGGCKDQLRLAQAANLPHFHGNERRTREVKPGREFAKKAPARIVLSKTGWPRYVQMISEMRDPSKDFWRPYGFETNVLGRSELPDSKLKLVVGLQFLSGNPQRLRALPNCNSAHQRCG